MTSKLEHALALAAEGYYVFPVKENGKTPLVPWTERSNRNPDTIKGWWASDFGAEHNYNIGIDCGKSGILVVDVDCKNNQPGKENYEKLEQQRGFCSDCLVQTPSGGLHLYYKADGFGNTSHALADGIDTRGNGGYVLAAGSEIDGRPYYRSTGSVSDLWNKGQSDLPLMPDWLGDALSSSRHVKRRSDAPEVCVEDNPDDIAYAIELLQNLEGAAEDGTGDITTYKTFCKLKERGISLATAIGLALEHWNPNCSPPWEPEELKTKAENAYRYGQNATGALSPHAEFDIPKTHNGVKPEQQSKTSDFAPAWRTKQAVLIPRRRWVIPGIAQPGKVTVLVAEPGGSKSTWSLGTALAKASGKPLMGFDVGDRGAVAIFNNEDDLEEMERRLVAAMQAYKIAAQDIALPGGADPSDSLLFINSGDKRRLRIAKRLQDGRLVADDVERMIAYVKENNIQLLIADPLSETHAGQENSNEDMVKVGGMYRYVAQRADCAVLLIHHTRKPDKAATEGYSGNPNSARGASSLIGVARTVLTLGVFSKQDCARYNIPEKEKSFYIVLEQAKANMTAPGSSRYFYHREGVLLGGIEGDNVGVLKHVRLSERAHLTPLNALILEAIERMLDVKRDIALAEIAKTLCSIAEFSDKQPRAMDKALRRLMSEGLLKGDKGVLTLEDREGVKFIHYVPFEKTLLNDVI